MARIAVLFDIDDIGGGDYSRRAWHILLTTLSAANLGGCVLSHGDTDERIRGRNRPYCWAIALDCVVTQQGEYVTDALSRSDAKGLMPVTARFAQGHVAMEQSLIAVGRVDGQGHFVLLDDAYVWLLIAADKAGWRHKIDAHCVGPFVRDFVGRYEHGLQFGAETNLVLARSFGATGGPEVLHAIEVGLRKEEVRRVKQAYEQALTQMRTSVPRPRRRWWEFWR